MTSQLQDKYEGKVRIIVTRPILMQLLTKRTSTISRRRLSTMATESTHELDQNYQANMQVIYEKYFAISNSRRRNIAESGSVALEPKTGGVRGVVDRVAGDDKPGFGNFNYATQSKRSPGSTIKPLVRFIHPQ